MERLPVFKVYPSGTTYEYSHAFDLIFLFTDLFGSSFGSSGSDAGDTSGDHSFPVSAEVFYSGYDRQLDQVGLGAEYENNKNRYTNFRL